MTVESVVRAFRLLEAAGLEPADVNSLARQVGLSTGTTSRLVDTLVASGALRECQPGTYMVGDLFWTLTTREQDE